MYNNITKVIVGLVLVLVIVLGIWFFVVGQFPAGEQNIEEPVAEVPNDRPIVQEPDEKIKIVVGGWPAGDTAFEAIIPGFNQQYPNIEVELSFIATADHHLLLTTAIAAGSGAPDVAMIEQAPIGTYRDMEGLENLLDAPYNAGELKGNFVEYKWNLALSVDGTILVGLPWDIGPATLFYRRDVFEEAGLPSEPEEVEQLLSTWEGFLNAAEMIYKPGERWILPSAHLLVGWQFMNRDFFNERLEFLLDKPGVMEALEAAITMRKNGWDAGLFDMWTPEVYSGLAEGRIASVVAGCWYGGFIKTWIAPETSGLWGVTRLPGGIGDSNWGGSYLAIPSQSENKEAAWSFIRYALATKEAQNIMFEAVDYFPAFIPAWDDPLYTEPDPFFGGQKTRSLWAEIAAGLTPSFSTPMDATVEEVLNTTVNTGIDQGKSADEIISMIREQVDIAIREDRYRFIEILEDAGLWEN